MKKRLVKWFCFGFCLICTVAMCCSCSPTFKNIKDVNCYLKKQQSSVSREFDVHIKDPVVDNSNLLTLVTITLPLGTAAPANMLKPGMKVDESKAITGNVWLRGSVNFFRNTALYRKEPGKPEWDLAAEVLKKAGPVPQSSSCQVKKFEVKPSILNKEYKGDDGHVTMGMTYRVVLGFADIKDAETPCTAKDLRAYYEYVKKIAELIKTTVEEDERSNPPFCAETGT